MLCNVIHMYAMGGTGLGGWMQVVCFFCMFSRREVLRFMFGSLDPGMRGYVDENEFQVCAVCLVCQ